SAAGDIGIDENRDKGNIRFFEEALSACDIKILDHNIGEKGVQAFNNSIERHTQSMKKQGIDFPEPDVRDIFYDVLIRLRNRNGIEGTITKKIAALCVVEFEF